MKIFRARAVVLSGMGLLLALASCSRGVPDSYQGYFEGEYLYLAAPQGGYLKSLDAGRGARVAPGQTLFVIAADPDDQALAEAEARTGSARQKLENLKEPRRPTEIAALEANLKAAKASLALATVQLTQQESLFAQKFVPQARVDEARAAHDQAAAQVQVAEQQIATYRISLGRQPELLGAQQDLDAAAALASQRRWVVERKTMTAPDAGEITETYYRPGEWVPPGAPVTSLLPDGRRRLRFFVPETVVAQVIQGDVVEARCDGCAAPIRAKVEFVAAQAEYTPPVIYSQGSREKLVFRVDALPDPRDAILLRPGLPADVRILH